MKECRLMVGLSPDVRDSTHIEFCSIFSVITLRGIAMIFASILNEFEKFSIETTRTVLKRKKPITVQSQSAEFLTPGQEHLFALHENVLVPTAFELLTG